MGLLKKTNMKKVLCPVDFSDTADHVITYAAKLCKKLDAELTLLNVQSAIALPATEVFKGKYLATEQISDRLDELSYQVMKVFKISCRSQVEASNANLSDIITQRGKDFDLIVMGINGVDDYNEFFFGTRSYQVAKESAVPVLLLPNSSGYQDISSIVFAFDYEQEQKLHITQLIKFAGLLKAKISILQVKDQYTHEAEVRSKQVEERIKLLYNLSAIEFDTIFSDEISEGINSYVLKTTADALALCSVHHTFIERAFHKSVIKKLNSLGTYPIFVFHE